MTAVAERAQSVIDADHAIALEAVATGRKLVDLFQYEDSQIELFDIADFYRYAGCVTKRETMLRAQERFPDEIVIDDHDLQRMEHDAQMLGAGYQLDAPISPYNAMWTDVLNGDVRSLFLRDSRSARLTHAYGYGVHVTNEQTLQGLLREHYLEGTYYRDHSKGYDMELIDTEATDTIDERGEI